jgi:hypothetical protein
MTGVWDVEWKENGRYAVKWQELGWEHDGEDIGLSSAAPRGASAPSPDCCALARGEVLPRAQQGNAAYPLVLRCLWVRRVPAGTQPGPTQPPMAAPLSREGAR